MSEANIEPGAPSEGADDAGLQPEVEETQTPEGEEGEEGEGEGEPKSKRVDWEAQAHDKAGLAAKERSRRRAVERELIDTRARIEALEAKATGSQADELADLAKLLRDDDDEPITDLAHVKRIIKAFVARQAADQEAEAQQQKFIRTTRSVSDGMTAYEQDFAVDHPDYFKAAGFYREQRQAELEDMGYQGATLNRKLAQELYGLAGEAMTAGRDPAEVVYNMAKRRGFASGKDAANAKLQKLAAGSGSAQGPRAGKGADNGLSWNDVSKLSGAARDAAFAKLRKRELGRA
jgi:hypothetical protein